MGLRNALIYTFPYCNKHVEGAASSSSDIPLPTARVLGLVGLTFDFSQAANLKGSHDILFKFMM